MNNEIWKEKAKLYLEEDLPVFIKTISDRFYNGVILEIRENVIIIEDKYAGRTLIMFEEITLLDKARDMGG